MSYRQYKTELPNCKTVSGSYNSINKTITVYLPQNQFEINQKAETVNYVKRHFPK